MCERERERERIVGFGRRVKHAENGGWNVGTSERKNGNGRRRVSPGLHAKGILGNVPLQCSTLSLQRNESKETLTSMAGTSSQQADRGKTNSLVAPKHCHAASTFEPATYLNDTDCHSDSGILVLVQLGRHDWRSRGSWGQRHSLAMVFCTQPGRSSSSFVVGCRRVVQRLHGKGSEDEEENSHPYHRHLESHKLPLSVSFDSCLSESQKKEFSLATYDGKAFGPTAPCLHETE